MCCYFAASLLVWCNGASFSNVLPRNDTKGNILNAHDGQIVRENGTYYWFAAGYQPCLEQPGLNGCAGCSKAHIHIWVLVDFILQSFLNVDGCFPLSLGFLCIICLGNGCIRS